MRLLMTAAALVAIGLDAAHACSCGGQTREEAFRGAYLLFEGIVETIEIRPGGHDELSDDPEVSAETYQIVGRVATFRVEREIKGVGEATRAVDYNIETGGNCGMAFEIGKRYRVFAYGYDGRWGTGSCSHTIELLLAPNERNYSALDKAETEAAAHPEDPTAGWRLERIRSEIDDDYFFDDYLRKVEIGEGADLDRVAAAFRTAFEAQDFERAEALARRAVAGNDGEPDANLMLAMALREREQFVEALAAAERALALDPGSLEARDEAERLRFLVRGEAAPGRRDYRKLYAKSLDARKCVAPRADFSDSAFGEADFSNAMLEGARFRRLVAGKASFNGARLAGARFDRAGVYGDFARSKGVYGFHADLTGADLRRASFAGAKFSSANFANADLRDADFTRATIQEAQFTGARIAGARFSGAKFYTTRMDRAQLGVADFSQAKAVNISWRGVDMRRAKLDGADLNGGIIDCETKLPREFALKGSGLIPEQPVCGRKAQNRDFSGLKWPMFLRLKGFDLKGADFSGGEFDDAEFQNANLSGADFSGAQGNAAFSGADLSGASFRGASIRPLFTAFTDYEKRDYSDAVLDGVDFSDAQLDATVFLTGEEKTPRFSIDLSTAIFERAHISCKAEMYRDGISDYDEAQKETPFWLKDASAEDRARWLAGLKRDAEAARNYLQAEGEVVRHLAERWPTIEFEGECFGYLTHLPSSESAVAN